jgi:putative lipoprotein (rSAM/lipoprotein system)
MRLLKKQFLKTYTSLLSMVLALLGISSCNSISVEYGAPSARFIAQGQVVSEKTEQAIEGIQVIMEYDTSYTDNQGNYAVEYFSFPENSFVDIQFRDVDDSLHGKFMDKDTNVYFENPAFGKNEWTGPDTEVEVNIKLKSK